jgi:hypothetical protein
MNDLADCLSQITPEDCPDDALRMRASRVAATVIESNFAEFRGPTMALDVATAGREIRNKWYSEHNV